MLSSIRWKQRTIGRLRQGGKLAHTAKGPIEYAVSGRGFPVVVFHATPGGYDQGLVLGGWLGPRFSIIAPSRPGYLGTALEVGRTPEEQADAVAALLDAIGISRVAVIGASGGGPAALQFALKYPSRTTALVLWQAISRTTLDAGKIAGGFSSTDAGAWLTTRLVRIAPAVAFPPSIRSDRAARRRLSALMSTLVPIDIRRQGVDNDTVQINTLRPYPLERIDAPTLIVHGEADATVPYSQALAAAQTIPNARLAAVKEATHQTLFGDTRAVHVIGEFLAEQFGT